MLRIISGLFLLIISQISFASTSTTTETIAATNSIISAVSSSVTGYYVSGFYGLYDYYGLTKSEACSKAGGYIFNTNYCVINSSSKSISSGPFPVYSCSSGFLSDSSGIASSSGHYCTNLSCISGYTLSGTNCTKENTVDSCTSYAGQSAYFWVSKQAAPSTVCSGTCLANISGSWGDSPDADPAAYTQHQYTYTGATGSCTSDSGFADEATATESNAAVAEKERLAKVQKAIDDAITACGGVGFYTTGTFNGQTVVTCTNQDKKTTSTTTTTVSGSTSTTTNDSTTTNNNGQSTTVNSDGSTSTSGGTTTTSGHTTTTTTTTNPDGSTTTTTTASGATGTCDQSDMKDTAGCASLGEAGSGDSDALEESEFDWGFTEQSAFGGASDASCPASVVIMKGVSFEYDGICQFLRGIRPFILAVAYIVAAMIALGLRTNSGGD